MKKITKILAILNYVSQCITAITKGAQEVANNWPVNSPFASDSVQQENTSNDQA